MSKKFRKKRRLKLNKLIIILFIISVLIIIKLFIGNFTIKKINNEMLITILNDSNNSTKLISYIKENLFNNPISILKYQINIKNYKEEYPNEINMVYKKNELPLIYIYNSHQGEEYSYEYLEDYNIVPSVLTADSMLKDKLENLGIKTIVEEADILEYMNNNNLNHALSYVASRIFLEPNISKYPSIELFIDLHRDAATHNVTTTIIEGKKCAKVLFVIGLEYDTYEKNLEKVTDLNNIILERYPTLTRGIMKKEGYGVNGVYNQDLNEKVILMEIGGNENNIEEINNTLDLIARVIEVYINEKK